MAKPVWFINDEYNNLIGFFQKEDDMMVIVDLKGNRTKVSPDITLKQVIRILKSRHDKIII